MTDWDRLVLREAGILAVCAFIALVCIAFFGEDLYSFWKMVGWIVVIGGLTRIGVWLAR